MDEVNASTDRIHEAMDEAMTLGGRMQGVQRSDCTIKSRKNETMVKANGPICPPLQHPWSINA
jgi:hypothetical protein